MRIHKSTVNDLIMTLWPYHRSEHMWFLGAGASVSSGVPAAAEIVFQMLCQTYQVRTGTMLDGKRSSYERKVQMWAKKKLSWFDPHSKKSEYAQAMENVFTNRAARHKFLENCFKSKIPGAGYQSLGRLIKLGAITTIWTTNFDFLVERSVPDLRNPIVPVNSKEQFENLDPTSTDRRLIHLHGDFWHGDLVNTPEEFRKMPEVRYDALRSLLTSQGLVVVGYSGQDSELMKALIRAASKTNVLRKGLFWCIRKSDKPSPLVRELLQTCGDRGNLVTIDGFDDLMVEVEQALNLKQKSANRILDEPGPILEANALMVDLCDQLTPHRPPKEARELRRTALVGLCQLMEAWSAAVVVRLPKREGWRVDLAVDGRRGETLSAEGRRLTFAGGFAGKAKGLQAGYQVLPPNAIRHDPVFKELSNGHPVHVIEVRGRTTLGFVCLALEGEIDDTVVEFKTARAISKLLVDLAFR
jgi:hypothetical protein